MTSRFDWENLHERRENREADVIRRNLTSSDEACWHNVSDDVDRSSSGFLPMHVTQSRLVVESTCCVKGLIC